MAKVYGEALAEQIREEMARYQANIDGRWERINQGLTDMDDCFMSQRVEERGIANCKMQLEILEGDGTMEIEVLLDKTGNVFEPRWIETRYGCKMIAGGVFANSKKALLKKTGWAIGTKRVPCWTKFCAGSGGGMCAVYTGSYQVVRWHTNMVTGEYVGFGD